MTDTAATTPLTDPTPAPPRPVPALPACSSTDPTAVPGPGADAPGRRCRSVPGPGRRRRRRSGAPQGPLAELVAAQGGLLTRAQALQHGLSPDAVDRRLAARHWVPVQPRVYRDTRHPVTEELRVRAVVLWAGEGAVLTGAAAAWWWGLLDAAPETVTVTVPRRRAPRPRAGIQVRRRGLDPADVAGHAGIAVVAPALAVLEAALEPHVAGEALLIRTLAGAGAGAGAGESGPAHVPDLAALTAARARTVGAHGSAAIGRMLASASRQAGEHALQRLRALLVRHGVPGWRCEHEVAGVVLRLAFPAARIAVEIAGAAPAKRPGTGIGLGAGDGEGAGWRHAVLRRNGWRVIVLDPADPWRRPCATVAAVHPAPLARSAPAGRSRGPARTAVTGTTM